MSRWKLNRVHKIHWLLSSLSADTKYPKCNEHLAFSTYVGYTIWVVCANKISTQFQVENEKFIARFFIRLQNISTYTTSRKVSEKMRRRDRPKFKRFPQLMFYLWDVEWSFQDCTSERTTYLRCCQPVNLTRNSFSLNPIRFVHEIEHEISTPHSTRYFPLISKISQTMYKWEHVKCSAKLIDWLYK